VSVLLPMENPVRDYAWGSVSALPRLLRETPTGQPQAELWMGAHSSAPSVVDGVSLAARIDADPVGELGDAVVSAFGARLPFLLKLLAAASPLSLQAHPSLAQAAAGFAAENAAGIPLDARERNYKDDNHKPELICALTTFRALGGFRALPDTLRLLDGLAVPAFAPYRAVLDSDGLPGLVGELLGAPGSVVEAVAAACAARIGAGFEFSAECEVIVDLAAAFPGDPGVLIALLLNYVVLEPGEALFLPAGNLHSYLTGTGVEILANSDNVLRGGLTPKHVDTAALLSILDCTDGPAPLVHPVPGPDGSYTYPTPVRDFALSRYEVAGTASTVDGEVPQILVCVSGSVEVADVDGSSLVLGRGRSAYLPAGQKGVTLTGRGTVYRATTNLG
jgi:mannose-6-phosphate isomerase